MRNNKPNVAMFACVLCLAGVLLPVTGVAKRLAYSKNYGVEIFAEEQDSQWCREKLDLRLNGDAESSFESGNLQTLISKLGKIIVSECPGAATASIAGYLNDRVIYRANISRQENWMLRPVPAANQEETAAGASATASTSEQATVETEKQTTGLSSANPSVSDQAVEPAIAASAAQSVTTSGEQVEKASTKVDTAVPEPGRPTPAAFKVKGWSPPGDGRSIELADGVKEYIIKTRDGGCGIRYSSINEEALVEFLRLDLDAVGCRDGYASGKGKATIKRSDGQLVSTLQGHFVQGYNVGPDLKDAPIVSRYISNRNAHALSVFLESDRERKIHYIGQLIGSGDVWGSCRSMMITAVTEDEDAYLDAEQIKPVVQKAGNLARDICPNIRQIEFLALSIPAPLRGTGTEAQYFYVTATRAWKKEAWTYNTRQAQNYVINRKLAAARAEKQRAALEQQQRTQQEYQLQLQQQQRAQQRQLDYQRLETADFASRVAFLHEAVQLDNPIAAASRSLIQEQPVKVTVLVHVDDTDGNKAEVDKPSKVNLTASDALFENKGWHIITGDLTADGSVDNSGFLVPSIAVTKVTRCTDGRCREVDDVLALMRMRYQDADWSPTADQGNTE